MESLDHLLIRAESIASFKIENLHATSEEYARALYGNNSNASAVAMVAGTNALTALIASVDAGKKVTESALERAHRTLMKDVPREQESAGAYRRVQNWIDGSNHSPLGAIFVPPPPENVESLMKDLLEFANCDDIPALVQASCLVLLVRLTLHLWRQAEQRPLWARFRHFGERNWGPYALVTSLRNC